MSGITMHNATHQSNQFISSGSLLYLDGKNYSGSGTSWVDLSTNLNNGTLVGNPTFNGANNGYFTFNGSGSQYVNTTGSKFNVTYTGKTVLYAARLNSSAFTPGVSSYRCLFGSNGGSLRNWNTYIYHDASNILYLHFSAGSTGVISNPLSLSTNSWFVGAITQTVSGIATCYFNGQVVGSFSMSFSQWQNISTESVALSDNFWYGDIAVCAIYGRTLSTNEINQNYYALRSRYGI